MTKLNKVSHFYYSLTGNYYFDLAGSEQLNTISLVLEVAGGSLVGGYSTHILNFTFKFHLWTVCLIFVHCVRQSVGRAFYIKKPLCFKLITVPQWVLCVGDVL